MKNILNKLATYGIAPWDDFQPSLPGLDRVR